MAKATRVPKRLHARFERPAGFRPGVAFELLRPSRLGR